MVSMRMVAVLLLLTGAEVLVPELSAQPVSKAALSVTDRIGLLLNQPPSTHPDSIKKVIPLLNAYQELAYQKRPAWHTPLSDRQELFLHRAKSHFLSGIFKTAWMQELAQTESGVLPVIESAIADLDSAAFYLRKIEPYAEGTVFNMSTVDGSTARAISDSLKALSLQMKTEQSVYASQLFSVWRVIDRIRPDSTVPELDGTLTLWLLPQARKAPAAKRFKYGSGG